VAHLYLTCCYVVVDNEYAVYFVITGSQYEAKQINMAIRTVDCDVVINLS